MPRRLVQVAAVASTFRTSSRTLRHPPHPPANGRHERDHWPPAPTRSSPARLEAVASPRFRRSLATVSASVCKHRSWHGMAADTAPSARWAPTTVPPGAMRLARTTATTGARTSTARRTTRVRDGSVARTGPPPPPHTVCPRRPLPGWESPRGGAAAGLPRPSVKPVSARCTRQRQGQGVDDAARARLSQAGAASGRRQGRMGEWNTVLVGVRTRRVW